MKLLNKLKCLIGKHENKTCILSSLETYWIQGGQECLHCHKFTISKKTASKLISYAYQRGVKNENTRMIAYAKGIDEILKIYPKELEKRGYVKH
jgi:hypothetical protein